MTKTKRKLMGNRIIIGRCVYCKSPIYEDQTYIEVDGLLYHYSEKSAMDNCYFDNDEEEEIEDE